MERWAEHQNEKKKQSSIYRGVSVEPDQIRVAIHVLHVSLVSKRTLNSMGDEIQHVCGAPSASSDTNEINLHIYSLPLLYTIQQNTNSNNNQIERTRCF